MTKGSYRYDFGDTIGMTPLKKMYTLGHDFIPDPIHAGGLRYHGMAPLVSLLVKEGVIEAESLHQSETFSKALQFARVEGIIPGPEPAHAVASAMLEAERARESGEEKVIVFNLRPWPLRYGGLPGLLVRRSRGLRVPRGTCRGPQWRKCQ